MYGLTNLIILSLFTVIIALSSLQAYMIKNIPCTWIGGVLTVILALLVSQCYNKFVFSRYVELIIFLLIFWLMMVTLINIGIYNYAADLPLDSTSIYPVFIILRFLNLLFFILFLYSIVVLCNNGMISNIIRIIVIIALAVCLFATYCYYAQILGWPEPLRTRSYVIGLNGEKIVFSSAFHRAVGSFREPSDLAIFLIIPFFFSLTLERKTEKWFVPIIILTVIFLTGSLTGLLATFIGIVVTLISVLDFKFFKTYALRLIIICTSAYLLFYGMVFPYNIVEMRIAEPTSAIPYMSGRNIEEYDSKIGSSLYIIDRLKVLVLGGIQKSNRYYIYDAFFGMGMPIFGYGMGNSNILLSSILNSDRTASFLNLYFNILYSGGIFGLLLMILFLMLPIGRTFLRSRKKKTPIVFLVLGAYVGWLGVYFGSYEELNLLFAVAYGLLWCCTDRAEQRKT